MRKKKLLFHSDFALCNSGFGKNARNILTYLYNTGKYDISHYCCNLNFSNPDLQRTPWKSIGTLPDSDQEINQMLGNGSAQEKEVKFRQMCYGDALLDRVITEEKPDVYIGVQDIWGVDYSVDRPWFNKIASAIWTTLDSLPILPSALEKARKIKNYWIWSSFATKDLHRLGHTHVKTLHGAVDISKFSRLSDAERNALRTKFRIDPNAFIIGFVFRNQLRKSVPNLLQGYKLWKQKNPTVKSYLLLHTHFSEGWNIHRLADEIGVDKNEILTTYVCKNCRDYEIRPFTGQDQDCHICSTAKTQNTTNVGFGVDEKQLNEVYNLMDVYCHPFTSGGQEIPIQEAKLTELITLVTNYSCGEEMCEQGSGSIPLTWSEYREPGTEFIKASTHPESIAEGIDIVHKMDVKSRRAQEQMGRKWVIDNFSIEVVCKQLEDFIDKAPFVENVSVEAEAKDPNANIPANQDNAIWVKAMYKEILKMDVDDEDGGFKYWMEMLSKGMARHDIENYFRQTAAQENAKNRKMDFSELLVNNGNKRYLLVIKESIGDIFCATALLKSIKEMYPDHDLYIGCDQQYLELFDGNPYVFKVLPYMPQMDSELFMTGFGAHKGYFDVYCHLAIGTQKVLNYLTNDKIALNLKY